MLYRIKVSLSINNIFMIIEIRYDLLNHCRDNVKNMLKDSIKVLNFTSNPERARGQINIFIEDVTKNMIKQLLPPNVISSDTASVLINAAYFKGSWVSKFNKETTRREIFYKDNKIPVYVDMMSQQGFFNYGMISTDEMNANIKWMHFALHTILNICHQHFLFQITGVIKQLNTRFLEMPYQGLNTSISMYIFLPVNGSEVDPRLRLFRKRFKTKEEEEEEAPEINIDQFLEKLTPEILDEVFEQAFEHDIWNKIHVEFPKMSFHDDLSLNPVIFIYRKRKELIQLTFYSL